jgi:hypothetical protein
LKLMTTCEETSILLSENMDVSLSKRKRLLLMAHLMMCRKCKSVKRQLYALREIFFGLGDAASADEIKMPESSKAQIKKILDNTDFKNL